ncbi:MAG: CPBP family intramembrane glutamic endopeptidase [Gammaproteobacteria bacterium]
MILLNTQILATYGILSMALAGLWWPRRSCDKIQGQWPWYLPLLFATIIGLLYGFLQTTALLSIVAFGLACYLWGNSEENRLLQALIGGIVLALTIMLFLHALPGFVNPKIISELSLSANAAPYNKYLNFDSALIGLGILGFSHRRLSDLTGWMAMLKRVVPIMLTTLLGVMLLSLWLGYVHWQPKWTPLFLIWAWGNLFFTCIAEEAFFRGFIQKNLMLILSNIPGGTAIALLISSSLFGLAHMAGGIDYVILATVAGIGYGWAYYRTQCIEAAILTHFTLNSLHFLLFTYPVLASVLR